MKVRRKREASILVVWSVLGLMLTGMGTLVAELWKLQVKKQNKFEQAFQSQSVRRVRLPAVRGKIYDTNGKCVADSVPDYCIAIYTAELRSPRSAVASTLELVHEITAQVGRKPDVSYRDIKYHIEHNFHINKAGKKVHEPLVAWKKLTSEEAAKWHRAVEERAALPEGSFLNRRKIPGLDLENPVAGNSIILEIDPLFKAPTSTAANTLELVYEISDRIGIPKEINLQDIRNHIFTRKPLPLLAWENITAETMAKWADSCSNLAGTDLYYKPARTYPEGENMAHLIGYTREADALHKERDQHIDFDMRGLEGITGLEFFYNDLLSGESGYKLVQIDVSGFHHRDLLTLPPQPGGDLILTIDENIQRFAMEALSMRQNGEDPTLPVRGACVVLDPNNGDVLAMVSSPTFDPNKLMVSSSYRTALNTDPSGSANNRAVYGQYPPGSTFKPIAALGVLREHPEFTETIYDCDGSIKVNRRKMRCDTYRTGGHGELNLRETIMCSCNVYMFNMALEVGFEPIHYMAEQMGLGQYAGLFPALDKPQQQKDDEYGNLPDSTINDIDLCNMAIGQGRLLASPLQMAMATAAIANGGTLYRPRLVRKWRTGPEEDYNYNPTFTIRRVDAPVEAFELVRGGMLDAIEDDRGTGGKARVPGIEIAGKTGTAQYNKLVNGDVQESQYTWLVSFAPYDFPRYAVAFIVEDGTFGGSTVGPRLSALYQNIFEYDGTLKKEATP